MQQKRKGSGWAIPLVGLELVPGLPRSSRVSAPLPDWPHTSLSDPCTGTHHPDGMPCPLPFRKPIVSSL